MLPGNLLLYGSEEPLPEQTPLRAGPLSLVYEAGDLRYIRLGECEIIRRLYVAVRDRNWGTVPAILSQVRLEDGDDSFRIEYEAEHCQGEIDFRWHGTIVGDASGRIEFAMAGEAHSEFLRNRIGLCLLHPIAECAGAPCTVEHTDGTVEEGRFPAGISPHQPFLTMRAISHEVLPGVRAAVRFAGDEFEMEDQRNWTDASFKTYSTPLRLSFPVRVAAGTKIAQAVTLTLLGAASASRPASRSDALTVTVGPAPIGPLPRLGLSVASHGGALGQREIALLRALRLAHLRVDLIPSQPGWRNALGRATGEARALGATLEIALFLSDRAEEELGALVAALGEEDPPVGAWLVFHVDEAVTPARWVELARRHLADATPGVPIGAGTNAYFTELNRGQPPVAALDLLAYSINPQVHAFDNWSLVETLAGQVATVAGARRLAGGRPVAVSPVTLRPRFNPNATAPEAEPVPGVPPAGADPRQLSLFGAGWTAGTLGALAGTGAGSVTLYETTGPLGVIGAALDPPPPAPFDALAGSVYPLYHVLAAAGEFAGCEVLPAAASDPLRLAGLAMAKGDAARLLLANLSGQEQRVTVHGLGDIIYVRILDETTAPEALRAPETFRARAGEERRGTAGVVELVLPPYAVAELDASRA